jgi:hypothetical protein
LFGVARGFDEDGQDHGAGRLVGCFADGAPDGLDDVDLGASGIDEDNAVERGDVDALREAPGVGDQRS